MASKLALSYPPKAECRRVAAKWLACSLYEVFSCYKKHYSTRITPNTWPVLVFALALALALALDKGQRST